MSIAPASRILPPDLDEKSFDEALTRIREVVGQDHVLTAAEDLAPFRDPYPVGAEPADAASAVVRPGDTAQVQAVMRIANEYRVPISPISRGKNNGYGGASPRLQGSVVLDLGARMNRILEVNEKFGYALLEPGVTYFQLYEHLQATGSALMIDCPDLGWGSVVGNALDRGVGYTPYGDHFMWQTGMEVVLPDGDVMRTGMGAVPGSNTWQLFSYGFGPYPDGMFSQSNLGIVTKMGIALMQRPPASMTFLITFENEDDLGRIVDVMLPLRINMAPLQNVPILRNIVLDVGVVSQRSEWHEGDGPLPPEAIERMKRELNLGYWNFYGTLYGPPPVIESYYAIIKEAFGAIPGARFHTNEDRPEDGDRGAHILHDRHRINNGIPGLDELKLLDWIPDAGHIAFSPVSAPDGEEALKQFRMVRRRADERGTDYAALFAIGLREMHHIALFLYDTHDPRTRQDTLDLARLLIQEAAAEGYGEYRTHNALMDDVMATYSWGDGALRRFHERVKDALDPNGVLAPGKSGIWPARLRDRTS